MKPVKRQRPGAHLHLVTDDDAAPAKGSSIAILPYAPFGLTDTELELHITGLRGQGWQRWELLQVFGRAA